MTRTKFFSNETVRERTDRLLEEAMALEEMVEGLSQLAIQLRAQAFELEMAISHPGHGWDDTPFNHHQRRLKDFGIDTDPIDGSV